MFVKKRPPQINQVKYRYGVNNVNIVPTETLEKTSYLSYEDIPKLDRENIETKIILPIGNKLKTTIDKLKLLGTKHANDAIGEITKTIDTYLLDINKNIEIIRLAEASVEIANLGLRGFSMNFEFSKGLQLNIVPESDNYEMFFDIIRKYVFLYKGSKWPPDINKSEYFTYNNPSKELCCFYWPLYAYIKTLFHTDFKGKVDLSDLFSLPKMKEYCSDFFKKPDKKPDTILITPKKKKKGSSGGYYGGDNKKNKGHSKGQEKVQNKKSVPINKNKSNSLTISDKVFEEAQICVPSKLSKVEQALRRTLVPSNSESENANNDTEYKITEYNALHNIVKKYIRELNENDLFYGKKSIEDFIKDASNKEDLGDFYPDSSEIKDLKKIKEKCKNIKIKNKNEKCIFDPLMGATFTYDNLQKWFAPPITEPITKTNNSGITNIIGTKTFYATDPCNILISGYNKFKSDYPLPSPMWKLNQSELQGIRQRFMKIISFLLITLKDMYESLKNKNVNNELKSFYSKLLQSIENERNNSKKQEMLRLKNSVEAKYGDLLKEYN